MSTTKTKSPAKPRIRNRSKTATIINGVAGMKLAGEIVTWNAGNGVTHTHSSVVSALKNAGLDEKVARELLPRHAFARACKKLEDERIIRRVDETPDELTFQFTRELVANKECTYTKETTVVLNKTTGKLSSDSTAIRDEAQRELDRCMEVRTTADITRIVQKLFDRHADLFPVRDQGGVYFVPDTFTVFTSQIQTFLNSLSGRISRFPVPMGTSTGDAAVQQSVGDAMNGLIREYQDTIRSLTVSTRKDTLKDLAERINTTRVKIKAYSCYLKDQSEDLLKNLATSEEQLKQRINDVTTERETAVKEGRPLSEGLDAFGSRIDSNPAKANAVLTADWKTMSQIVKEAHLDDTVYQHMKKMVERGYVETSDNGYRLVQK